MKFICINQYKMAKISLEKLLIIISPCVLETDAYKYCSSIYDEREYVGNILDNSRMARLMVTAISQIEYNQLHILKKNLELYKNKQCVVKDVKYANVDEIINIVDVFLDIDNFPNKICCRYMRINNLLELWYSKNKFIRYSHKIMEGIDV